MARVEYADRMGEKDKKEPISIPAVKAFLKIPEYERMDVLRVLYDNSNDQKSRDKILELADAGEIPYDMTPTKEFIKNSQKKNPYYISSEWERKDYNPFSINPKVMFDKEASRLAGEFKTKGNWKVHPDTDLLMRYKLKWFSETNKGKYSFLRKHLPHHEIQFNEGRVLITSPDGTKGILDEDDFSVSSLAKDVGDVAVDVAQALMEGAAVAAGGLSGAAFGLTKGGFPGAVIGGLTGAVGSGYLAAGALEAGRQKIGESLGMEGNVDPESIKMAANIGAITSLALGSGAGLKGVAKKGVKLTGKKLPGELTESTTIKPLIGKETRVLEALSLAQRGAPAHGFMGVGEKTGRWSSKLVTGADHDLYKTYADNLDTVREMKSKKPHNYLGEIIDKNYNILKKQRMKTGEDMGALVLQNDVPVNINEIVKPIDDAIEKSYNNLVLLDDGARDEVIDKSFEYNFIEKLESFRDDITMGAKGNISSKELPILQNVIEDITNRKLYDQTTAQHLKKTKVDTKLEGVLRDVDSNIADFYDEHIPGLSKKTEEYRKYKNAEKFIDVNFREDPKKIIPDSLGSKWGSKAMDQFKVMSKERGKYQNLMDGLEEVDNAIKEIALEGSDEQVTNLIESLPTPLKKTKQIYESYTKLIDAPYLAMSGQGVTSTLRGIANPFAFTGRHALRAVAGVPEAFGAKVPEAAKGLFGDIGYTLGQVASGPLVKRNIMISSKGAEELLGALSEITKSSPKGKNLAGQIKNMTKEIISTQNPLNASKFTRTLAKELDVTKQAQKDEQNKQKQIDNIWESIK